MREGGDTIPAFLLPFKAALAAQLISGEVRGCSRGLGRFPQRVKSGWVYTQTLLVQLQEGEKTAGY